MNHDLAPMEVEQRDGRLIIRLDGEIDLSNADRLQQRIEDAAAGSAEVVLDLSAVEYVDSQGLRLLSQLSKRLAREGSTFKLVAPPGTFARSVLELTLIREVVEVVDAVDGEAT